jgi:hypothetical protein
MDYDVIFVDEGRNAVTDHRCPGGRPATPWRPLPTRAPGGSRTVVVPPGARPTVITGTASGYYQPPAYYQPAYGPAMPSFASRFGMTTGELIDTGIQLLAAITPLPAAPTAQGESITDVENLMTYQGALAQHAKRDEQLRTLGNLLVRILK